ncbi:MAG: hypothetical protein AB1632_14140 [Nitrospirota bacterium]
MRDEKSKVTHVAFADERCCVLSEFNEKCKNKKFGVSLKTNKGLGHLMLRDPLISGGMNHSMKQIKHRAKDKMNKPSKVMQWQK